ncbi:MAG: DUF983 domain-containing protein [Minwuia sp.]|uniref:DUF983 domain-containing protein n=1 Tax=Minwuia sp. TaxID=2493630 RepID=UPI003A8434A8
MGTHDFADQEPRSILQSLVRGLSRRCPSCGEGRLLHSYVKVNDHCPACGEAMHHHRADDMPPYLTIFIVGHLIIPFVLMTEQAYAPPTWVHWMLWIPLVIVLSLWLLPRLKGAVVGLQWANRMHGFGGEEDLPVEP